MRIFIYMQDFKLEHKKTRKISGFFYELISID
jgi:hypothetical protein